MLQGKRAKLIVQSPAVVTRGRKVSASDQFVVDVDMQSDRSLLDSTDDDKGIQFVLILSKLFCNHSSNWSMFMQDIYLSRSQHQD